MKKNNRKGFTIVELVIVIAVIAILAAVLIPTFAGIVEKANESKALQEAKNAYTADLALLDGVVEKDAKGDAYVKTKDSALDTKKTYYTYSEESNKYSKVDSPAVGNIKTYYEVAYTLAGEFDIVENSDDYTYTYKAEGSEYTCVYDTADNEWTVEKND